MDKGLKEFSSLLFTVTSTYGVYSPPPLEQNWLETGLQCKRCLRKPQVWELSRFCLETSTKLYVHAFGFSSASDVFSQTLTLSFPRFSAYFCKRDALVYTVRLTVYSRVADPYLFYTVADPDLVLKRNWILRLRFSHFAQRYSNFVFDICIFFYIRTSVKGYCPTHGKKKTLFLKIHAFIDIFQHLLWCIFYSSIRIEQLIWTWIPMYECNPILNLPLAGWRNKVVFII